MKLSELIKNIYPAALQVTDGTGLLPQTLICQALLESWKGTELSGLALNYNNWFGIKGTKNSADSVQLNTTEYINGLKVTVPAWFKKYPTIKDSFTDYVRLMKTPRYSAALNEVTPEKQLQVIAASGYATAPNYAQIAAKYLPDIEAAIKPSTSYIGFLIAMAIGYFAFVKKKR